MAPFPSTLLLISTLLFVSVTIPLAQAANANTNINVVPSIASAILAGTVECSNTSLSEAGTYTPISNVPVDVVCGDGSASSVIKSGVTNLEGAYFFLFTTADTLISDPNKCDVKVAVPQNSCVFNIPNGFLRYPLVVFRIVDAVIGTVLLLVPGVPTYVLPA